MRWSVPQTGDKRTIKKFAVLPITINGEVRWLEKVTIIQMAYDVDLYGNRKCWHNQIFREGETIVAEKKQDEMEEVCEKCKLAKHAKNIKDVYSNAKV